MTQRVRRSLFVVVGLLIGMVLMGMVLSCGRVVRNGPRPGSGAASVQELVAIYREAHEHNDPERLRNVDLALSLLGDWIPMDKDKKAALRSLFKLDLEDVRVVEMPVLDPDQHQLEYVCEGPRGTPRGDVLIMPDLRGRLVLIGRRPDGARVEVDPGFGVTRLKERLYMEMLTLVAEDAARSISSGTEPRYRLIPHGTQREYNKWDLAKNKRTWPEVLLKLDELERKAKKMEEQRKGGQAKAQGNEQRGGRK